MPFWRNWPYAATAIVQWEWVTPFVYLWVTFRHPMDITVKPAHLLWKCESDSVAKAVGVSTWQDEFTILLRAGLVGALPNRVTLEYDGPDANLRTTWGKQWEPFGPILGYRAMGAPYTGTKTWAVAGPTDNVDVEDVGMLFLDCSANDVIIGGFTGGALGQHLIVVRTDDNANDATLEHNEAHAFQKIFLHMGLDETLAGEYGGWVLACNGVSWFDAGHSKHV